MPKAKKQPLKLKTEFKMTEKSTELFKFQAEVDPILYAKAAALKARMGSKLRNEGSKAHTWRAITEAAFRAYISKYY